MCLFYSTSRRELLLLLRGRRISGAHTTAVSIVVSQISIPRRLLLCWVYYLPNPLHDARMHVRGSHDRFEGIKTHNNARHTHTMELKQIRICVRGGTGRRGGIFTPLAGGLKIKAANRVGRARSRIRVAVCRFFVDSFSRTRITTYERDTLLGSFSYRTPFTTTNTTTVRRR